MKTIHTLLAAMTIAMLAISCENEFDVSDKADSLISVTVNTLNNQAAYNVGETAQAELWIQRGGLKDASGKVQFVVDPLLLDSLNQEDKTNYELLPENCYEMTNTEFTVDKNELCGYITYHPEKILALSAYNETKYVLPLRLISNDLAINPARNTSFLAFTILEPIVHISNAGVYNINPDLTSTMDIQIGVPFTNKWDILCNLTEDLSLIDEYNQINKVNFTLLPENAYTAPESVTLQEGVSQITASYQLKNNLVPGNYILPIKIGSITASQGGVPNNSLVIDEESNVLFCIVKEGNKINKSGWEVIECSSEHAGNEATYMIDDNESTYWHCKFKSEAGSSVPPFHFIIDMKKEITIAQIDLLNRGDGAANNIKWVEFYASNNNSEWDKIGAGDFNDEGTRATFRYYVKSTKARYLKLIIPEGYGNNCPPAAIRELTVYGLEGNN